MGLFNLLKKINKQYNASTYSIDEDLPEYDNWLNFISNGGTQEEWEELKRKNNWKFKLSEAEEFDNYHTELEPIYDKYFKQMNYGIKSGWSRLYKNKDYTGEFAKKYEQLCIENIETFKKMIAIEKKYNHYTSMRVFAYERLAMLYERQKRFDKAIEVCNDAIQNDASAEIMQKRLDRLLNKPKKANNTSSSKTSTDNLSERQKLDPKYIDECQRIPASKEYCQMVWNKYYSDYQEKPFISKDRELNTHWLEQAEMFPDHSIISKKRMTRYKDGLLPGHIYMLYWIDKYKLKRRIPAYFEYKYGIEFMKEKRILEANGFIENDVLTKKGNSAIKRHMSVINNH